MASFKAISILFREASLLFIAFIYFIRIVLARGLNSKKFILFIYYKFVAKILFIDLRMLLLNLVII